MRLDRLDAEVELTRDLRRRMPLRQEPQHLDLPRRQATELTTHGERRLDRGAQPREVRLRHEVRHARFDVVDDDLLAQRAGDDDQGSDRARRPQVLEHRPRAEGFRGMV